MFKIYDGREHFYQWDLERKLIVEDPTITEVHFCNRTSNCSLVCETYVEDGITLANVPNILLQTDWKMRVYAYDGNYTKHDKCYEIKSRTKPDDYVYTETEVKRWETLEKEVAKIDVLKGSKSDEKVVIDDVATATHELEVEVSQKNMFIFSSAHIEPVIFNGETKFGVNTQLPSGTYTINTKLIIPNTIALRGMIVKADETVKEVFELMTNPSYTFTLEDGEKFKIFHPSGVSEVTLSEFMSVEIEIVIADITDYKLIQKEPYKEFAIKPDGKVEGVYSTYPTINLYTDAPPRAINIKCIYNRDINKAFAELTNAIISLGGNV